MDGVDALNEIARRHAESKKPFSGVFDGLNDIIPGHARTLEDDIKEIDSAIIASKKDHTGAFAGLNDIEVGVDYKKTVASPV